MTDEEKVRVEAVEVYFAFLATTLGRYAFEGGEHRQFRQRLQQEIQSALEQWIASHPKLRTALRERLLALHGEFFRNVDSCRDHFECRDS